MEERPAKKPKIETTEDDSEWIKSISILTVAELIANKSKIVVISHKSTIEEALKILSKNSILSAPVVEGKSNKFLGIVDVLDITGYILHYWRDNLAAYDNVNYTKETTKFLQENIAEVLNYSGADEPVFVDENSSVYDLLKVFVGSKKYVHHHRIHRVAVLRKTDNTIRNVVSQSDIIALANSRIDSITSSVINTSIKDLNLGRSCIMVRIDSPFIDSLELLYANRVSGIALVDNESRVSANLSASDLRGLTHEAFEYFNGSTLQFLVKGTKTNLKAPISVTPATPLKEVISVLVKEKVHRVYVTDDNNHIYGVVTLSDILPKLVGAQK